MKRFDILTLLGILIGLGLVIGGIVIDSPLGIFWNLPGLMITVGGSFGALLINFQIDQVRSVFMLTRQVFFTKRRDQVALVEQFIHLSQRARREGLLVLEDELEQIDDPFMANGLQMVIDGFEPETIRNILETEIEALDSRHALGQRLYRTWGGLAPAFGMVGTLIGLVQMLTSLDDPSAIGPGMAVALLTTFYGVLLANLFLNPIAGKLAIRSSEEIEYKATIIEGLMAIQQGVNPRLLKEKMKAFLSPAERRVLDSEPSERGEEMGEMGLEHG